MKTMKRIALFASCVILILSAMNMYIIAEGKQNLELQVERTAISIGDTFSATLLSKEMAIKTIACGISFDSERLDCVSITGGNPENPAEIGLNKLDGATWIGASASPTVAEANNAGCVGATFVGTADTTYAAGEVFTVVFRAKAAGNAEITVFEDSDGTDGQLSNMAMVKTVTIYDSSEAEKANVYFTADKTSLSVGEQMTVTMYSKEMTVSTFAAGIGFDNSKLKCISIEGSDADNPGNIGLTKNDGNSTLVPALIVHTPDDANASGNVGLTVLGMSDTNYASAAIFKITFEAIAEGEALISLYEDSDGADGYRSDNIMIDSIIIGKKGLAVRSTADSISYSVSGQVVTVSCDVACKAGYLKDGAYVAIAAVEGSDGSYSFTAPEGVTEVLLTVKGDANLDGRVTAADIARINAHKLGKTIIGSDEFFAGDVTGDGAITDADIDALKEDVLRASPLAW